MPEKQKGRAFAQPFEKLAPRVGKEFIA